MHAALHSRQELSYACREKPPEEANRPNSAFKKPASGEKAQSHNSAGKSEVDQILSNPGSKFAKNKRGQTTVTAPNGKGLKSDARGKFQGFLEP